MSVDRKEEKKAIGTTVTILCNLFLCNLFSERIEFYLHVWINGYLIDEKVVVRSLILTSLVRKTKGARLWPGG